MDVFGHSFHFRLPGDVIEQKSWSGLAITLICMILIIFYSSMNLIRLIEFGEPTIMVSLRDSFLDTEFQLTTKEGL